MLGPRKLLQPAARYPADPRAVFILALSVFSGIGTLVAQKGPETLESLMPSWGVLLWGITLSLGSFITLWGLSRDTDIGIILEQVGSVMVGSAATFYSVLAILVAGPQASQVIVIVLAWGLACFIRWYQLQLLINKHAEERQLARLHQQLIESEPDDVD